MAFPDKHDFSRMRMQRLLSLKLYQAAAEVGRSLLAHKTRTIDDMLFVAEALLKSEQGKLAVPILEAALLEHPHDNRLRIQLAHAWLKSGQPLTAARAFEKAALLEGRYARDAAEIYRENGFLNKALKLNARIEKQDENLTAFSHSTRLGAFRSGDCPRTSAVSPQNLRDGRRDALCACLCAFSCWPIQAIRRPSATIDHAGSVYASDSA